VGRLGLVVGLLAGLLVALTSTCDASKSTTMLRLMATAASTVRTGLAAKSPVFVSSFPKDASA
jgi:hypothetical protein